MGHGDHSRHPRWQLGRLVPHRAQEGKHTKEAVELAKWLTAPDQEEWLFKNKGNFPSDVALWDRADIAGYTDPFFADAPVGKIFSESASNLKPQPYRPHSGDIGNAIANALVSVEQRRPPRTRPGPRCSPTSRT